MDIVMNFFSPTCPLGALALNAQMITAAYTQLPFEQFERAMRQSMNWTE